MPSPSVSATATMPPAASPHSSTTRAPLMRRLSSQSSQASKHGIQSPGSGGEHHPLRHAVKPARRTKVVVPRNHSSARDLAKLGRQAQTNHTLGDGRKNSRQKSHEGDTEIRLPGSLDDNKSPPMRRNMTASQLPRNVSHTKLKKNLSHGQLSRISSGKNLAGLNATSTKGPPSPGLKNRKRRPKSADMGHTEKDLQHAEAEQAQVQPEKKDVPKKVGFAVGSLGDSEIEDAPEMEGSGLQEDEWTDQSASASPYSTRQNTANNSRRASVVAEKPPDKRLHDAIIAKEEERLRQAQQNAAAASKAEEESTSPRSGESEEEDEATSPYSMPQVKKRSEVKLEQPAPQVSEQKALQRSSILAARDLSNPATRHVTRHAQSPAPALISNVSTLDVVQSSRGSPAPSMRSPRSNIGDGAVEQDPDELVSRFIPSASHPSTTSGSNTTSNTPKTGSLHTPETESILAAQRLGRIHSAFPTGPVSPGSTISGSSGAATPAMQRSRTELKMMNERAMAEMEEAAARNPIIPPHVYDRRNESLKSYLNVASLGGDGGGALHSRTGPSLGPELFQGRFKAVNTELKVVQKFRDPIDESLRRLQRCDGAHFAQLRRQKPNQPKQAGKLPISKSAVSLPKQPSKLSTSTSPPKSASPIKPAVSSVKSTAAIKGNDSRRSRVTFSQTPPETREVERPEVEGPDAIAKQLWDSDDA